MTTKRNFPTKKSTREHSETNLEWSTTAVHFPKRTLQLLKLVAFHRAQTMGGRISVSKLVSDIVESHRKELERELNK
jgi:hypothetical protein